MMIRPAFILLALSAGAADAATPTDLRDYALAECLVRQTASSALRDEGYRLGAIAMHRAGVGPGRWKVLDRAVDGEVARRPMTTTHVDAPVGQSDRPVPLAHCLAIIEAPGVKRAMAGLRVPAGRRR